MTARDDNRAAEQTASRSPDTALAALATVAAHYRVAVDPAQIAHDLGLAGRPATFDDLIRAARRLRLRAKHLKHQAAATLSTLPLPAIIGWPDGTFRVVLARTGPSTLRVGHPVTRLAEDVSVEALAAQWSGDVVLITRRWRSGATEPRPFGLAWFLPALWRYRIPLSHVLLASVFVQLFALITPLMFQVVVDKVLVHHSEATLVTIVIALLAFGFFDVLLQFLRSYKLSHTACRIDVELGSRAFDHMLRLPLSYFETRPTGQTVARMREIENIRAFLTGQGLTAAVDLVFTVVFLVVMYAYSPLLTALVVTALPAYAIVVTVISPFLRSRIDDSFNAGAASQQFLVESTVGIHALKSAAVEPQLRNEWEDKLAAYVSTSFAAGVLSSLGQMFVQYITKILTATVLFVGAYAVMEGTLSVGGLIAFNMLTGQVVQPVLRLAQLWQEFQRVRISVERLGDVFNVPPESTRLSGAVLPPARGAVRFSGLTFRYEPGATPVLDDVDIEIAAGKVVGIYGPSGSGKSTLAKLLQGMYRPERGRIEIDGVDIAHVDTAWLRRQVGVVLQESILFNRSIHDNIAIANPGMSRQAVMQIAMLAGAHEFITRLPLGYDTTIVERGLNMSGGQRQRVAIARALAAHPRILVFDEATSALDYESERIIKANMRQIVQGRTVIVIAHRLSTLRACDILVGLDQGAVVETGTHVDLLARPGSLYGRLWRMQADE